MLTPVINVNALSIERQQKVILVDITFSCMAGDCLHVQGKNGSGKSTLLATLAGIRQPLVGSIIRQSDRICYLAHDIAVQAKLTVIEQLLLDPLLDVSEQRVKSILQFFELDKFAHCYCSQLSQGQRQRLALARIMAADCDLYLLDEPINACDDATVIATQTMLRAKLEQGAVVIFTSHQFPVFAELSPRTLCLSQSAPVVSS